MIKAVVFDLDDTLIPETEYVKSGFRAIGKAFGDSEIADRLFQLFKDDKRSVYQRAGFSEEKCNECIKIYRSHMPDIILPAEISELLKEIKAMGIKTGIITDGRPEGQWNKIFALGLDKIIDKIIVTDELGGEEFRKPHPKAFELMQNALGVEFSEMMYVGDNPAKDFYIGSIYPIVTIRLLTNGVQSDNLYFKNIKEDKQITSLNEIFKCMEE